MTLTDWRCLIDLTGADITPACEWGISIEETLGQPAIARFVVQDRASPPGYGILKDYGGGGQGYMLDRLAITILINGRSDNLFRGMIMTPEGDLPVGMPWPKYTINAQDYQPEVFDRRLVGTPNGYAWTGPDAQGNYRADDPNALSGPTDQGTVRDLLSAYCVYPVIDTATFVNLYTSNLVVPATGASVFYWDRTTLRSALDDVASFVSGNLQYWIDPNKRLHWVVIPRWFETPSVPGSLARGMPQALGAPGTVGGLEVAPASIDNDNPDGVTTIGSRGLRWSFDYSGESWEHYVSGGAGFAYNGGVVDLKGTGFVFAGTVVGLPALTLPMAVIDTPWAVDAATKAAASGRVYHANAQGLFRGQLTVGNERHHPDGWHVGQIFHLHDSRLPGFLNDRWFVIQRVTTKLLPGVNWRVYDLEFGDAPVGRLTASGAPPPLTTPATAPGRVYQADVSDGFPLPSGTVTVVGQLVDDRGNARYIAGLVLKLKLEEWDATGTPITPDGTLSTDTVITDINGRWQVDLTVGPHPGYKYHVAADESLT